MAIKTSLKFGKITRIADIRNLYDLKDVVYDLKWFNSQQNFSLYYMYRDLYKNKFFEIDIIAFLKKCLVIVEVRTKKGENFGSPEESLNKKKLKKLLFGAQLYVVRKKWKGDYRVDAVCIVLKPDNTLERINHYENIVA